MKKIIWLISIVVGIISGYFSTVEAISASPSIVKLSIISGESKSGVFEVYNGGKEEVYLEVFMKDWILVNNERKFASPGSSSRTLSKWITFEEESFNIKPGGKRAIRYMVDVPTGTEGGYWGLVCFQAYPLPRKPGIRVATQLVSFVAVEVEETLKKKVEITQVLAEHVKDKGARLRGKLKNVGNTPLFSPSPSGKFKITDINNNIIAEGALEGVMILPEEIGDYTSDYFKLDKGEYPVLITFDYGGPKLIGRRVVISTHTFYEWTILKSASTN